MLVSAHNGKVHRVILNKYLRKSRKREKPTARHSRVGFMLVPAHNDKVHGITLTNSQNGAKAVHSALFFFPLTPFTVTSVLIRCLFEFVVTSQFNTYH
jgi:hypothetical protein